MGEEGKHGRASSSLVVVFVVSLTGKGQGSPPEIVASFLSTFPSDNVTITKMTWLEGTPESLGLRKNETENRDGNSDDDAFEGL